MSAILRNRVQILKQKPELGISVSGPAERAMIEAPKAEEIKYRRLFDPFVTLWTFLSQVLDSDKTCHNAVSRVIAWLAAENAEIHQLIPVLVRLVNDYLKNCCNGYSVK